MIKFNCVSTGIQIISYALLVATQHSTSPCVIFFYKPALSIYNTSWMEESLRGSNVHAITSTHFPVITSCVLHATVVLFSIPPYTRRQCSTIPPFPSVTEKHAFTIATSSSRRLACLYAATYCCSFEKGISKDTSTSFGFKQVWR